ncbi:MAG: hypothetical protein WCG44_00760 [bacterium]
MKQKALVISADELKKTIDGYSPRLAEQFHSQSAHLADQQFAQTLIDSKYKKVVLMSGGTASGKTEFMLTQLTSRSAIIVDTTLPTIEGARIKISKVLKVGKKVEIYSVIPDKLSRAFIAFLHRDRVFSEDHFYRTHSQSRVTLLWISQSYPNIKIHLIESKYTSSKNMSFTEITFMNRSELIEYLENIQLSQDAIIEQVINFIGK